MESCIADVLTPHPTVDPSPLCKHKMPIISRDMLLPLRRSWPSFARTGAMGTKKDRVMGGNAAPDVVHAGPPDLQEGGQTRSSARSWDHHTLLEGKPLCPTALSAVLYIHSLRIRVGYVRYLKKRDPRKGGQSEIELLDSSVEAFAFTFG